MPVLVPYVANTSRLADLLKWYGESQARSRERLGEIQAGLWSQLGKIGSQAILDIGEQRRTAAKEAEERRFKEEQSRRENERLRLAQEAAQRESQEFGVRLQRQQFELEEAERKRQEALRQEELKKRASELVPSLYVQDEKTGLFKINTEALSNIVNSEDPYVIEQVGRITKTIDDIYAAAQKGVLDRQEAAQNAIRRAALAAYLAKDPKIFAAELGRAVHNEFITQSHAQWVIDSLNPQNFEAEMLALMGPQSAIDVKQLEVSRWNASLGERRLQLEREKFEYEKENDSASRLTEEEITPFVENYIGGGPMPRFTGKHGQANFRTFGRVLARKVAEGAKLPVQTQALLKPILNSINYLERYTGQVEAYERKVIKDIDVLKSIARGESPDGKKIYPPLKDVGNQWLNKPIRELSAKMGSKTEQDFLAQLETVKAEVARVLYSSPLSAGAIPVASMKKMDEMLPKSLTVKQLLSTIDRVVIPDVRRRVEFLRKEVEQYHQEFDRALDEARYGRAVKLPEIKLPMLSDAASGKANIRADVPGVQPPQGSWSLVPSGQTKTGKPVFRLERR